jgi:hypothetical protein
VKVSQGSRQLRRPPVCSAVIEIVDKAIGLWSIAKIGWRVDAGLAVEDGRIP